MQRLLLPLVLILGAQSANAMQTSQEKLKDAYDQCNKEYAFRLFTALNWCQNLGTQEVPFDAQVSLIANCKTIMREKAEKIWSGHCAETAAAYFSTIHSPKLKVEEIRDRKKAQN